MSPTANCVTGDALTDSDNCALELRIFRVMVTTVGLAVIAGAVFLPWRVASGLFLGGVLSLLNYHWLRTSMAAVFRAQAGSRPKIRAVNYIVRYLVIGVVGFAAYKINLVSLPAMIAGLCSFVVAFFFEALRQSYFSIIRREEFF